MNIRYPIYEGVYRILTLDTVLYGPAIEINSRIVYYAFYTYICGQYKI